MNIQGKTILITGGGSGIGLEAAAQFLQHGAKVIITGRNQDKLNAAKQRFPALEIIQNDVADPKAASQLYETISAMGGIDILYNNAGVVTKALNFGVAHDKHVEDAEYEMQINYLAVIRLNNLFIPMLQQRPESAIINTTSILSYQPIHLAATYSASKVALRFYNNSLRAHLQLINSPIKVFELAPPAVATDMADGLEGKTMPPAQLVKALLKGLAQDQYHIRVGDAKVMYYLTRFAPTVANRLINNSKHNQLLPRSLT